MQKRNSPQLALFLTVCVFEPDFASSALAETDVGLGLEMYAGLSVTGEVGALYQVQYAHELSETNTWYALQHFELKWNPHQFVDETCPASERRFYRAVEVEVPADVVPVANMIFLPPGTFVMGSPESEPLRYPNETQHEVTLTRGFWMGKYEVTQEEYASIVGDNPSFFTNWTPAFGSGGSVMNESRHPVEQVTWSDATHYCEQLTAQERAAGRLPEGYVYRMPTETEWEYACRAGTTTAFHYGDALRSGMANFDGRREYPPCGENDYHCENPSGIYLGRTTEVGSYAPNAWGFYDMHGNVMEWCSGWLRQYPTEPVTDPIWPDTGTHTHHPIRGGEWINSAWSSRSAGRFNAIPDHSYSDLGFRVVLAPE